MWEEDIPAAQGLSYQMPENVKDLLQLKEWGKGVGLGLRTSNTYATSVTFAGEFNAALVKANRRLKAAKDNILPTGLCAACCMFCRLKHIVSRCT